MSNNRPAATRHLWLLVTVLLSLLVALIAGMLKHSTGVTIAEAILTGGAAFAGSLTVCLVALAAIRLM